MKKAIILFVLVLMVSFAFADREITGEITCNGLYVAGSTNTVDAVLTLASPDVEWATSVDFTFPEGVTPAATQANITGGSYELELNNVTGQVITWGLYDTYTLGYLSGNGSPYTITFVVDVAADFSGTIDVDYNVDGEDYGAPPHSFSGTFTVDPALDDDLVAVAVAGNITPSAETAAAYTISVYNQGQNAAESFDVTLYEGAGNMVGTVNVATLAPGATEGYDISWTPTVAGPTVLYGVVDYTADMNTTNNQTPDLAVSVQASDVMVVTVGTNTGLLANYMPANFYWKNSLSESWFYPEEFGAYGAITAIQYFNNFDSDLSAGTPLKIWMGETAQADAEAGWIPSGDLTMVFDGSVSIPSGVNEIMIPLETPFVYTGAGNLVVYVNRPLDDDWHSYSDRWEITDDAAHPNRTRYMYSDSNEFDPANPDAATATAYVNNEHANIQFFMTPGDHGMMEGYVYQDEGRDIIAGAEVTVTIDDMEFTQITDATGYYYFPFLFVGEHSVTTSAHGYYDTTEDITIVQDELLVNDIYLVQLPNVNVSAHVITSDTGADVAAAEVTLEGYENYMAVTDASGMFTIPSVYSDQTYTLTITYEGYETYVNDAVAVGTVDLDLGDLIVEEIAMSAMGVIAEENHDGDALIVWNAPGGGAATEFRWDDGVSTGQLGTQGSVAMLGGAHLHHAMINEVTWYTTAEGGPHNACTITILGLDDAGVPDVNQMLYQADITDAVDLEWNVHVLPEPVEAENGFYLGYTFNGFDGIGTDDGVDDYPYTANTQYISLDWTAGNAWETPDVYDFPYNFMIRANGLDMGEVRTTGEPVVNQGTPSEELVYIANSSKIETGQPKFQLTQEAETTNTRLLETYNIHRLVDGDQDDTTNWLEIATGVTDTTYVDETWSTVDPGEYRYAVTAIYTNGVAADPAFSNIIASDMTAAVTVNVTTNGGDDAAGATVTMTNIDGVPEHVYTAVAPTGGSVNFPEVWLGVYDLTISLNGFEAYSQEGLNVFDDMTVPVELTEIIADLGTLMGVNNAAGEVYLSWAPTGAGNVLLVDDDGSADLDFTDTVPYYTAIFDEMGIDYTVIEIPVSGDDGPDAATMAAYDVVIWECGEQWNNGNSIGANDETNMGTYVDGGGKIIVSGHDYMWDAYSSAGAFSAGQFPYDYLGVGSVSQDILTIGTSQGGPAAADCVGAGYVDGLTVQITDIFSAGRDGVYLDNLTPNDMGADYCSVDGYTVGVQTANSVFTTAGYAGLVDGNSTVVQWMTDTINNLFVARDRAFLGYTVTRDGGEIATGVMDMEYTDTGLAIGTYEYTVTGVYSSGNSNTISTTVEVTNGVGVEDFIPVVTELKGNYPNPFNPTTKISFSVVESGNVTIDIYNLKGEKVKTLVDGYMNADFYNVEWNGTDDNNTTVASGVYFYKMKAGRYTSTKKMILMK